MEVCFLVWHTVSVYDAFSLALICHHDVMWNAEVHKATHIEIRRDTAHALLCKPCAVGTHIILPTFTMFEYTHTRTVLKSSNMKSIDEAIGSM